MLHARRLIVALGGAALALALPLAPAHAQFRGILGKAAGKVVGEKAVEKVTGKQPAHGGGNVTIDQSAVDKIVAYDQAYVAEFNRILATDARFAKYQRQRADYERCYARDVGYQKAIQRYTRLAEQARLDEKMAAFTKWQDSLNTTRMASLKALPPGGCAIPELGDELEKVAAEGAGKAAGAKTGLSAGALAGMQERVMGYLSLSSPEDRSQAVSSGAYKAEELAAMDRNRAGLQAWMSHVDGRSSGLGPDAAAVAKYDADMERYRTASETYAECSHAAQGAGAMPAMPSSMQAQQAQMANMKEPSEAQLAEAERLGKLGEAAANRGDRVKTMAYRDSVQRVLGMPAMAPQNSAENQAYARSAIAAQKQSLAAQKKCGIAPDAPIKPAYMR